MLDGLHSSSFYTSGSFTVGGTSSNFYPVQFTGSIYSASSDLILYRNEVHENGTWYGTFNFTLSFHPMNYGNWSGGQVERIIYQTGTGTLGLLGYHDPVGDVADGSAAGGGSDVIIWLKGGATYHWRNGQVTTPWTLSNGNSGGGSITDSSGNTRNAISSQSTLILNAKNRFYTSMGLGTAGDLYVAGNVGIGTTGPVEKLEISNGAAIRLNTNSGQPLNLFAARGDGGTNSGNVYCTGIASGGRANAVCLAAWDQNGAVSNCGTALIASHLARFLCVAP